MKTMGWLTILLVGFAFAGNSQEPVTKSPLHSMVETERAFSQASEEKGTRDSFLMFIAEDGILFRPTAVLGKKWLQEHPVPFAEKRPLLAWQPIFADMAAAGDMGYTFGPWEFKKDIKDKKPVAFGHLRDRLEEAERWHLEICDRSGNFSSTICNPIYFMGATTAFCQSDSTCTKGFSEIVA